MAAYWGDCTVSQKDLKTMNGDPQVARSQDPESKGDDYFNEHFDSMKVAAIGLALIAGMALSREGEVQPFVEPSSRAIG
ncbi:MAG TPA: hypothetical protein VMT32_17670 [Bryobacteraceae bacterium]|nr:hypothetical protein [Bryobacteraceae bacterium]